MYNIKNRKDLRTAYEVLGLYESFSAEHSSKVVDKVIELKREIRKFQSRPVEEAFVIRDEFDYMLVVFPLPADIVDEKDADDYFIEEHLRVAVPSQYDCTGQVFTTWYKIFKRRGRYWVYHATAMDV